jgi:DNA mismatch endonuclease, patch repair protein
MADVHTKEVRSFNMSRIRGENTKPEILVRKFLFSKGLRYRLHKRELPGKPDIVFGKDKKAVFIHGCYWHGHAECKYFVPPKTRSEWWAKKIGGNRARDEKNITALKNLGWEPIIVWECQLKPDKREKTLDKLLGRLGYNND